MKIDSVVSEYNFLLSFILPQEEQYIKDLLWPQDYNAEAIWTTPPVNWLVTKDSISEMNAKCHGAHKIMNDGNYINI